MTLLIYGMLVIATLSLTSATESFLCITVCTCKEFPEDSILNADCSRTYLSIVFPVDDWPENVTSLDFNSNNISEINVELVHENLKILDLGHNRISTLAQSAFGGLKNLEYLNLADNKIGKLDENAFYGLFNLKSLNISSNSLNALPRNVLHRLMHLEELSLADNPFVHLDADYFNRLINLKWLNLENTGLYTLPANIFHPTVNLEFVDLSSNDFHEIPTDALRSASKLKYLRLNENPVEFLHRKSFLKLETLEVLEISLMPDLKEVKSNTFSNLVKLQKLVMQYNPHLDTIHYTAFDGLFNQTRPVLQEINLEKNHLSRMDERTIACERLKIFNVQKNPWFCDCSLKWIKQCHIQKIYAADLRCSGPKSLEHYLIINLEDDEFDCKYGIVLMESEAKYRVHQDHVVRSISVGVAVAALVIISLGLAFIFKWRDIRTWYRAKRKAPGAVYYVRAHTNPREI